MWRGKKMRIKEMHVFGDGGSKAKREVKEDLVGSG